MNLFFGLFFSLFAQANLPTKLKCQYMIYGAPFAEIHFFSDDQKTFLPSVKITHYGQTTWESLVEVDAESGEWKRFHLSAESEENWLIVAFENLEKGWLINPHMSTGNKMIGSCH